MLFRSGTDWRRQFVRQHDLSADWLRPFAADCTWRDLALLTGAFAAHRAGLGRFHEISVAQFMRRHRLSERCTAWMRATALGGIAGTTRMTMWELFHRLGGNLRELVSRGPDPLYWNAQPPNAPGGFVAHWATALAEHRVALRLNCQVQSIQLDAHGRGAQVFDASGSAHSVDAVFLAVPPPALAKLLGASDDAVALGFGLARPEIDRYLGVSKYEHVGAAWFFDTPLPRELPLGGHNVRRGWHPILVQHKQYQAHLPAGVASVVTGSIATDTDFRHHRLGTKASDYSSPELAAIVWEDERLIDPSLPEAIDIQVTDPSSATQIVELGPLPLGVPGSNLFLATNLHGLAPYFTASLEAAIQAGAIAAAHYDARVERLPGTTPATNALPWTRPKGHSRGARLPGRRPDHRGHPDRQAAEASRTAARALGADFSTDLG